MKVCHECDGFGFTDDDEDCPVCDGSGQEPRDLDDPYDVSGGLLPLTAAEQIGTWG
jgi:RecJ-like exonuclease